MMHEAKLRGSDAVEATSDVASYEIELSDGRSFHCRPDETILRAALKAGLNAPYECASGACGSCKCRVKSGASTMLWEAAPGLSDRDRAKSDRILACQTLPRSDMILILRAEGELPEPTPERWLAAVESCVALNAMVMRIVLRIPAAVQFLPGQFCLFEIPGAGRRAYSMANLPNCEGRLEFLIKRKRGGAGTGFLMERLGRGASLRIEGPYGRGYLRSSSRPIVAVAGGSGLAPMLSILRAALKSDRAEIATLYFGVNETQELFCLDDLAEVARGDRAQIHLVIRDTPSAGINGFPLTVGLVGDAVVAKESALEDKDLYVAGPWPMVDDLLTRTVGAGRIPADRVFFDRFL
jgi:toluene monooxygenase electron transfer component